MKALKLHAKTDISGIAYVEIPTEISNSEVDLIVVVESSTAKIFSENKIKKYDFSEFAGKLNWDIDPLEYQRSLREEY